MAMRRKKRNNEEHENHERWLVSYADYMTLLFALFVVLYAFAQTEKGKSDAFASELVKSFQDVGLVSHNSGSPVFEGGIGITGSNATAPATTFDIRPIHNNSHPNGHQPKEIDNKYKALKSLLKGELGSGKLKLEKFGNQIVIKIKSHMMFAKDSQYVQPHYVPLLAKIGRALAQVPGRIHVVGHTSRDDAESELYRNNWDLSALRAVSVANVLLKDHGISSNRIEVDGVASTEPSSKTSVGGEDRRVEITLTQGSAVKGKDMDASEVTG